mgnify:CR=1 FL=1
MGLLLFAFLCPVNPSPPHNYPNSSQVKFIGEEGVDEGGVAKEFFQLLVRGGRKRGRGVCVCVHGHTV